MNLKIYLLIALFIAIACSARVDAGHRSSRHRKKHHNSSHKHSSDSYHKEGGHNKVESDHHSTSKQHSHDLDTKTVASSNVDGGPNNQKLDSPANSQHQNKQSSENDFAEGFSAGLAAARRQRRRRTTTVAPSTTTVVAATTLEPCLSNASMPSNSSQPNLAISNVNCEILRPTTSTPLQNLNEQLLQ